MLSAACAGTKKQVCNSMELPLLHIAGMEDIASVILAFDRLRQSVYSLSRLLQFCFMQ